MTGAGDRQHFAAAAHVPLALYVRDADGDMHALAVIGWAWSEGRRQGECVVVLKDGTTTTADRLPQQFVEVVGVGPFQQPAPPPQPSPLTVPRVGMPG